MNRDSAAVTKRVTRALTSLFYVEPSNRPGEYHVHNGSGSTYLVTLPKGSCTCPDSERGPWCKHAYHALFVTGYVPEVEGVSTGANATTEDSDSDGDLAERIERFTRTKPDASAIEALSQLEIDPTNRERVEELLSKHQ